MRIADLFYMIIHDERGTSRLHKAATEYGLAAALLAELVRSGHIEIDPNERLRIVRRDPPQDLLAHKIMQVLLEERSEHPLRTWLKYFGLHAVADVAQRIAVTGQLEPKITKGFMGLGTRKTVYVPVRPQDFEAQFAVLRIALMRLKITDADWHWCAGLSYATGLSHQLLVDAPSESFNFLDWIVARQLPISGPPLITACSAVIAEAVFAHR